MEINAYLIEEIVSNLPLEALSIATDARKDNLLIGSRQGHLISCDNSIDIGEEEQTSGGGYVYQVCRTFEKNPVLRISIVEDIILALTDAHLSIHESIEPFRLLTTFTKYKPIFNFAHHLEQDALYLLISTKNRLIIIRRLKQEFEQLSSIDLLDNALQMIWTQSNSLFVAMKSEYQFFKLHFHQQPQQQQRNSSSQFGATKIDLVEQPKKLMERGGGGSQANENASSLMLMVELADRDLIGLCREDKIVEFVDINSGKTHQTTATVDGGGGSCVYSHNITALVYDSPFLIATIGPSGGMVEIRSFAPSMLIQKIVVLPKVSMLSPGNSGVVYAASETQAWKLNALARLPQTFEQLKAKKQFELALHLANAHQQLIGAQKIGELKRLMAAAFFNQRSFTRFFEIHAELGTDVIFVANLFPNLIPEKYAPLAAQIPANEVQQLYDLGLTENERKSAIQAFIQYLSMKRNNHSKPINLHYLDYKEDKRENILPIGELKRHETSLELIDTILLKCYLQVNPTLVAPLLRLKNCSFIVSEAEKNLKEHKMLDELLILYERKKLFRKYLELLQRELLKTSSTKEFVGKNSSFVGGVEKIAHFLSTLKREHFPLILEFSSIVLRENTRLGVEIFTRNENSEAINFDRDAILQFFKKEHPDAVTPYLEHIIYQWRDQRPKFHEELLRHYLTQIQEMIGNYVKTLSTTTSNNNRYYEIIERTTNSLSNESADPHHQLSTVRKKFRAFLENDQHYTIKDALKLVEPSENLIEERAILYGRLGRHAEALNIYTNILMNFEAAERHCQLYSNDKNQLFFYLFHFYVVGSPADGGSGKSDGGEQQKRRKTNITEALKLLRKYVTKINIVSAFALIPADTPLSRLSSALKTLIESLNSRITSVNLMLSLTNSAINRMQTDLNGLIRQRININERISCEICKKRIMESAFVRHRSNLISHFYCYKSLQEQQQHQS